MGKKSFLKSSLIILAMVAIALTIVPFSAHVQAATGPKLTYSAHVQKTGWESTNKVPNTKLTSKELAANFAGTMGKSLRMEALEINFAGVPGAKLEYRAHVQKEGWMDWTEADDTAAGHTAYVGTVGKSRRVEALQLSVKGLEGYSILYRAHVQRQGWTEWVDAADPTAYAGTVGKSLRMEAFEIVVLPKNEYYYLNNHNGTHTSSYNGKLGATEDCVFGDYTVDGSQMTRQCALCGYSNGEKVSLNDVLTEAKLDGQSKVSLESVSVGDEGLTIPEGMTLEVDGLFKNNKNTVKIDGHLVTKLTDTSNFENVTFGENGVLTYKGVYEKETDLADCLSAVTAGKPVDKIVMEEGSKDQKIQAKATIPADSELVLDLNGTKVTSNISGGYTIENQGTLTINNGKFDFNDHIGVVSKGKDSVLNVNGCEMTIGDHNAICIGDNEDTDLEVEGRIANITDTKIKVTAGTKWAIVGFGSDVEINLKNVEVVTVGAGLYVNGKGKDITLVGENVKIDAKYTAAYLPAVGTYTFNNSNITGEEGIEYTRGTLTLNNTKVTATGIPADDWRLTLTQGNGVFTGTRSGAGSYAFGAGVQLKELNDSTQKAELFVNGSSTIESAHAPAILVFVGGDTLHDDRFVLHYPTNAVSGYTKDTGNNASVVWAHKQ